MLIIGCLIAALIYKVGELKDIKVEADKVKSILDGAIKNPVVVVPVLPTRDNSYIRMYCLSLFNHINAYDLKLEDRLRLADKMYEYITTGKLEKQ